MEERWQFPLKIWKKCTFARRNNNSTILPFPSLNKTRFLSFVPPLFLKLYLSYIKQYGWFGNFRNWEDAKKATAGYYDTSIAEKARQSTRKVVEGKAAFERDTVLFQEHEYQWDLFGVFKFIQQNTGFPLHVIDFGGALGSFYHRNHRLFDPLPRWTIVEQENYVEIGRREFADNQLRFAYTIDEAAATMPVSCAFFAGVIQYLENPYYFFGKAASYRIPYIVIYDTPFSYTSEDIICVQKVSPRIYSASYPCRFLQREKFLGKLKEHYEWFADIPCKSVIYHEGREVPYQGFILKLRNDTSL